MLLKADLHVHTDRSVDSRTTIEQAVEAAKAAGLDFLAITDHGVSAPEEVFSRPERGGVILIPGVEYSTDKGHLLGLFLRQPAADSEHRLPFARAVERVREAGGLAVLAHPYESTAQTEEERAAMLREMEPLLDGLEVKNRRAAKKRANANELAWQSAEEFAKHCVRTVGSDAHLPREIGAAYLEIECREKSAEALREALLSGLPERCECEKCCNKFIAQSQKIKLQKRHAGPGQWARWALFRAVCARRDLKLRKG